MLKTNEILKLCSSPIYPGEFQLEALGTQLECLLSEVGEGILCRSNCESFNVDGDFKNNKTVIIKLTCWGHIEFNTTLDL